MPSEFFFDGHKPAYAHCTAHRLPGPKQINSSGN